MQLGISSYTYGWGIALKDDPVQQPLNELDLINKAIQLNVSLLQIGDNIPLHEFDEDRLQLFEAALEKNNILLEIGARGLTAEHLGQYILLCKRFRAKILRFVIDGEGYEPGINETIKIIQGKAAALRIHNITLALENHDRLKTKDFAEIINGVGSRQVGICLDTVNSMGAAEGLEMVIGILAPLTVNLHIKDFGVDRLPHKQGFIINGRVAGKGMLDIPGMLGIIKSYNRCHTAILEQWVPPANDSAATLKKEQDWAQMSIAYLKTVVQ